MNQNVGMAWYTPWEWDTLRRVAADPEKLEATHAEWLRIAKKAWRDLAAQGVDCQRVIVSVDELVAWCREHGRPVDGPARAAFVAEQVGMRPLARQDPRPHGGR